MEDERKKPGRDEEAEGEEEAAQQTDKGQNERERGHRCWCFTLRLHQALTVSRPNTSIVAPNLTTLFFPETAGPRNSYAGPAFHLPIEGDSWAGDLCWGRGGGVL